MVGDSLLPDFGSRFEVTRRVGAGGMGAVFAARDLESNTDVAVKLLPSVSADSLLRFKQEFRSLTELVHPNLISMYELLSDGEDWYFTMELIDGYGLRDWIEADVEFPAAITEPLVQDPLQLASDETVTYRPD